MEKNFKRFLTAAIIPFTLMGATACSFSKSEIEETAEPTIEVEHTFDSKAAFKDDDGSDIAVLKGSDFDIKDYFSTKGYTYSYEGDVDTSKIGEYQITVTAKDAFGATGTLKKTVKVVEELEAAVDLDQVEKITIYQNNDAASTITSNNKRYVYEGDIDTSQTGTTTTTIVIKGTTETPEYTGLADSETGKVENTTSGEAGSSAKKDVVVEVKEHVNTTDNVTQEEAEDMSKQHEESRKETGDLVDYTTNDEIVDLGDGVTENVTRGEEIQQEVEEENEALMQSIKDEYEAKAVADGESNGIQKASQQTIAVSSSDIKLLATEGSWDESKLDKNDSKIAYVYNNYMNDSWSDVQLLIFLSPEISGDGDGQVDVSEASQIGDVIEYFDASGNMFHIGVYLGNGCVLHSNWENGKTGIGPVELNGTSYTKVLGFRA